MAELFYQKSRGDLLTNTERIMIKLAINKKCHDKISYKKSVMIK